MLREGLLRCAVTTATTSSPLPNAVAPTPRTCPPSPAATRRNRPAVHRHADRRACRRLPLIALHPDRTARPTPPTDRYIGDGRVGTCPNRACIRHLAAATPHTRPRTHSRTRRRKPSTAEPDRTPARTTPRQPHRRHPRHGHHPRHNTTAHAAKQSVRPKITSEILKAAAIFFGAELDRPVRR